MQIRGFRMIENVSPSFYSRGLTVSMILLIVMLWTFRSIIARDTVCSTFMPLLCNGRWVVASLRHGMDRNVSLFGTRASLQASLACKSLDRHGGLGHGTHSAVLPRMNGRSNTVTVQRVPEMPLH